MPRSLSFADLLTAGECWLLLLGADLALRLLPFTRVRKFVDRKLVDRKLVDRPVADRAREPTAEATEVRRLSRLVRAAARRHLYPMTCLRQSLVLRWLLGRAGIPAELRLGARRESATLEAHAWVEYRGEPIGEAPDVVLRYATLDLPEQAP